MNVLIEQQASQVKELKEKNNALSRHLNYYNKKSFDGQLLKKAASLPLDLIVKSVNDLLQSQQQFKLMSKKK